MKRNIINYVLSGVLSAIFILSSCFSAYASILGKKQFVHYTPNEGLPYLTVTDFLEEDNGIMWVATMIAICRFDGYEFTEIEVLNRDGEIILPRYPELIKDQNGTILIRAFDSRIFKYNPSRDRFEESSVLSSHGSISRILPAEEQGFWVCKNDNIFRIDANLDSAVNIRDIYPFTSRVLHDKKCFTINKTKNGLLLILNSGDGLKINFENQSFHSFPLPEHFKKGISKNTFYFGDDDLWLINQEYGICRLNIHTGEYLIFSEKEGHYNKINHNLVYSIEKDKDSNYWIATEHGLNIWNPESNEMESIKQDVNDPEALNCNAIHKLLRDRAGNMWIGTYFGGINIWNSQGYYFHSITGGLGEYQLSGRNVRCVEEDPEGNIWIGLEGMGINRIDHSSKKITKFIHEKEGENSLSYDNVHALEFSNDGLLFIGTYTGGLNIYNPKTGKFTILNKQNSALETNIIYSLLNLGDSLIIGTNFGLYSIHSKNFGIQKIFPEISSSGDIIHLTRSHNEVWICGRNNLYYYDVKEKILNNFFISEENKRLTFVEIDSKENIWIGDAFNGLYHYSRENDKMHHYNLSVGFPSNRIFGLLEGENNYFWISTEKGLIKFNPENRNHIIFNKKSGLPFNQFNFSAFHKDREGNLIFGGTNGIIFFNEENSFQNRYGEKVMFTALDLFNERVLPGPDSPIKKPLSHSNTLKLKHSEKAFTIYYSGLNYINPGRTQYAYYLENFHEKWNYVENQRKLNFTNLSPGTYYLHVKTSDDGLNWNEIESTMKIIIKPPLYLSKLAFVTYGLLVLLGLFIFYHISTRFEKSEAKLALEKKEREHQEKMNQMKLEFYTDISHELKTPLTLIIGPLNKLLKNIQLPENLTIKLEHINNNAVRLMDLLNQLLEFRRIENGKEKLRVNKVHFISFIEDIIYAFEDAADSRNIQLICSYPEIPEYIWFDNEKLERIIFNLLSNALKFTQNGGKVVINCDIHYESPLEKILIITLSDNGKGISVEEQKKIFDRFYSNEIKYQGLESSGIGLSLVKKLIHLHKADIELQSEEGSGSRFTIRIPVSKNHYASNELLAEKAIICKTDKTFIKQINNCNGIYNSLQIDKDKHNILVVDDNEELINFLIDILYPTYNISTACNGKEAIGILGKHHTNMIISDIMMPDMDGLEFTKKIKSNIFTSHIPVIILTAKTGYNSQFEGVSAGADLYVEKPFYPDLLLKNIENIFSSQNSLIKLFKNDFSFGIGKLAHSKRDKEFLDKLTVTIKDNIENPDLNISFLTERMNTSRSLLHLKLKNLADCSASGYIRRIRFMEALKMISEGNNISESAYSTGFSSLALFSRQFKDYFGKSPRQYIKDHISSQKV